MIKFFIVTILIFYPLNIFAHSGGTDAKGCHKNRKTGEYHCHNKKLKSQEDKTPTPASSEKISTPPKNNRIRHWIDEKGGIHYSNNIKDVPANTKSSTGLK